MKYQAIINSEVILSDQEMQKILDDYFPIDIYESDLGSTKIANKITLLYVQSCEGMRKELFEKKEFLQSRDIGSDAYGANIEAIESTFKDIGELFKI